MENPAVNTITGGMNKDLSPLKYPQDKYYHLENFRIVTRDGASTASLENEKGNRLDFTIPSIQGVYKITHNSNFIFSITGQNNSFSETFDSNFGDTPLDLYNELVNNINISPNLGLNFNIGLLDDGVLIFGLDYLNLQVVSNPDNVNYITVPPQQSTDIRIVHLNYIDNNLILFTASNNGAGQIWYVPYNEQANIPEQLSGQFLIPHVHLKYNNNINLSTEVAINKSIVRKETSKVCRVYWTDNLNPLRRFNVLDPLGYTLIPSQLDIVADVEFSKPIITDISSGGFIPYGACVQFGYILVANQTESIVSPLSNVLPIYGADDEQDTFINIEGSLYQAGQGKAVSYKITNVDQSFDKIKHVAIIYEEPNIPIIKIFKTENILSNEIFVTFTNGEEYVTLTEQEINDIKSQFEVCKSITSQNNRLIAANTKSPSFEISDTIFDSRVYRYKSDSTSLIKDRFGDTLLIDSTFNVPETHDAINPFNDVSDPDYDLYKYQSDGVTLGGEGKYIKYKFVTKSILVDQTPTYGGTVAPFADITSRNLLQDGEYSFSNQFNSFKSPFVHFLYGGYTRDEIYRFGIVFYSKKGKPSFVKWIGDIKFPTMQEYPLENYNGYLYANQLGIEFDVTIPNDLQDLISGYEIVRLHRGYGDRTVVASGLYDPLMRYTPINNSSDWSTTTELNSSIQGPIVDLLGFPFDLQYAKNVLSFISSETLFINGGLYKTGDYFQLETFAPKIQPVDENNPIGWINPIGGGTTGTNFLKCREKLNYPVNITLDAKGIAFCGVGSAINPLSSAFPSLTTYGNFEFNNEMPSGQFNGGPKYIFTLDNSIDLGNYLVPDEGAMHYMTYRRALLNQYGGNTYEERSGNTYISTCSYQDLNTSSVFKVFGGDTYCNYMCYEYIQWADGGGSATSRAVFFVSENNFNVDLRHGNYFNKSRLDISSYTVENYYINSVYFQENNIIQYFKTKPYDAVTEDEQPYAIWASEKKQNGEQIDSWTLFKVNNQIEVDGDYGPINHITSFKDRIYFYQNQAIGLLPIEQQAISTDQDGIDMVLGTGDIINQYGYISTNIGILQHDAVVQSEDYIYNFDMRTKKLWRFSPGSKEPLSDIKGLSSYFYNELYSSSLENIDQKTSLIPIGIHGVYEPRYNRVLFTFNKGNGFTISYNESLNAFESFISIRPTVYLGTGRKTFSVPATIVRNSLYQHDLNDYGVFYGEDPVDSTITYLVNCQSPITKVFSNLQWYSQCFNNLNQDVPDETFEFATIFNDYQNTGQVSIQPSQGRRRFRFWNFTIPRDISISQQTPRIRNPWTYVKLTKSNQNNTRFIMHDLITHYYK